MLFWVWGARWRLINSPVFGHHEHLNAESNEIFWGESQLLLSHSVQVFLDLEICQECDILWLYTSASPNVCPRSSLPPLMTL